MLTEGLARKGLAGSYLRTVFSLRFAVLWFRAVECIGQD